MGKYDTVDPDALSTEAFLGMIDYTLLKPERSLADYVEFGEFARELNKHPRTLDRWCKEPDGLPDTPLVNKRYIHIPTASSGLRRVCGGGIRGA